MLREALDATGIAPDKAASLLGINPELFQEWIADQQPIPYSFMNLLSTVIGIDSSKVAGRKIRSSELAEVTPAIWYRFREPTLIDQDREFVFLIRQLGYFVHELEEVTESKLVGWREAFQTIRSQVDKQAPPRVQGRQAAQIFRDIRGLSTGATGIGEVFRGNLRSIGLVVIESPLPESRLEGCCFLVGDKDSERPCIFANSHGSTWFRRNFVLAHELGHAIFDAETAGATLDFLDGHGNTDISEQRADAFAQELLIPRRVLRNIASSNGINWENLQAAELAVIVSEAFVEKRMVLKAAHDAEFISSELYEKYLSLNIKSELPEISDHALCARDYISKFGKSEIDWVDKRDTTIPSRRLRLPPLYVSKVVEAFENNLISLGKAAEMLMIEENVFIDRFGDGEDLFDDLVA